MFFEKVSLKTLGLRIQLGHQGMSCINPQACHKDFQIVHTNGIHSVAIDACDCEHQISVRQQLLRMGWFPATVHYPQTACTQQVLEQFHILTLSGKISAYEYYLGLERLTDNIGCVPKVCYLLVIL